MEATKISTIILAGGKSSRMGTDKALLQLNNRPLLQIICETAQQTSQYLYVVTPWPERYINILPPNCNLVRELSSHGPLVAFAQGLSAVTTEWVLLLACDLPCLEVEAIREWIGLLQQVPVGAIALLPKHPTKGWEPLIGFYRTRALPLIEEFIALGGTSFQSWLAQQQVAELEVKNPQLLFNCNTPADWKKLRC
ncbi:molybdenum cofactor guanylyltransferase [Gloeocapsa sp. PCC 73106]|uniref:molybdenum cofactor guanylyltransferase n=1 Tax=Gloeocapsa sp. PCC 73106 TaxID=102232 RepID=UPI0002AC09C9|nr:molybdenum cofactor guanylyltransferase [Gloeocapsa sp. PCC 73106]ELR96658.1 molybdopterin-guanine dinucleotide biosynthesis protein A [Gloeocapsa sp. PCC 73106]